MSGELMMHTFRGVCVFPRKIHWGGRCAFNVGGIISWAGSRAELKRKSELVRRQRSPLSASWLQMQREQLPHTSTILSPFFLLLPPSTYIPLPFWIHPREVKKWDRYLLQFCGPPLTFLYNASEVEGWMTCYLAMGTLHLIIFTYQFFTSSGFFKFKGIFS